jgi:hypothetical protein
VVVRNIFIVEETVVPSSNNIIYAFALPLRVFPAHKITIIVFVIVIQCINYRYPDHFVKLTHSKNPPVSVHQGLVLCKIIQGISILFGYSYVSISFNFLALFGVVLVIAGQILNFAVYDAIGFNGVYYGQFH